MKKVVIAVLCAVQLFAFGGFAFGWGLDSITGGGGGVTKTVVESFFNISKKADTLMQGSVDALGSMLLNKDTAAAIDRKLQAAQAITDPKEKEAEINKIMTEKAAEVAKAAESKDATQKLAKLDAAQKKLAGAAVSNLFLSALANKSAVDMAKGIAQSAKSNPTSALSFSAEMPKIQDGVATLPGKVEKTYKLADNLVKIAKSNNIEVTMPKTASDVPQDIVLPVKKKG